MLYTHVLRPLLFRTSAGDPESAHEKALALLSWIGERPWRNGAIARYATVHDPRLRQEILGLTFHSPVGLAAGFDKNGAALQGLASLGFSHIEMGTITPLEQKGNPRPRMFRFPSDKALINRMGFNNEGAEKVRWRLNSGGNINIPLGISLGKGKDTPLEEASGDYQAVLKALYDHGDYFAVNVSSPTRRGYGRSREKSIWTFCWPTFSAS